MATETNVNNLVINVLSKQLFDDIAQKSDTELYLVPDVYDTVPTVGSINPVTSDGVYNAVHSPIINHGNTNTTFALTPNVFHIWEEVSALTLTLAAPLDNTIMVEYAFQFESGSTATSLNYPSTIKWNEQMGELVPESGKIYQVSIVNNIGLWVSISTS